LMPAGELNDFHVIIVWQFLSPGTRHKSGAKHGSTSFGDTRENLGKATKPLSLWVPRMDCGPSEKIESHFRPGTWLGRRWQVSHDYDSSAVVATCLTSLTSRLVSHMRALRGVMAILKFLLCREEHLQSYRGEQRTTCHVLPRDLTRLGAQTKVLLHQGHFLDFSQNYCTSSGTFITINVESQNPSLQLLSQCCSFHRLTSDTWIPRTYLPDRSSSFEQGKCNLVQLSQLGDAEPVTERTLPSVPCFLPFLLPRTSSRKC
jgi:hypothetical protein